MVTRNIHPGICCLLVGLLLVLAPGCKFLAMPIIMWGAEPTKKVPAEYPYLSGKKACILVWAEPFTMFEYPRVQLELSEYVRVKLEQHVQNLAITPNRQIVEYQDRNPDWDREDPAKIGQRFGADRVIVIELTRYTTREPDSPHIYRGHIAANVKVYDSAYDNAEPSYKNTVEIAYPADGAGSYGTDDKAIRRSAMEAFAAKLSSYFHERQEKK
ncbi:MAG: hypothetical protein ABIG44_07755 [Planctomycetota bacterium]